MLKQGILAKMSNWVLEELEKSGEIDSLAQEFGFAKADFSLQDEDMAQVFGMFSEWLCYDAELKTFNAKRGIDAFLQAHKGKISDKDYKIYKGISRSIFGVFMIDGVSFGEYVILKDKNNKKYHLYDVNTSMNALVKGQLFVGRIAKVASVYQAVGASASLINASEKDAMKAFLYPTKEKINTLTLAHMQYPQLRKSAYEFALLNSKLPLEMEKSLVSDYENLMRALKMERVLNIDLLKSWAKDVVDGKLSADDVIKHIYYLFPNDIALQISDSEEEQDYIHDGYMQLSFILFSLLATKEIQKNRNKANINNTKLEADPAFMMLSDPYTDMYMKAVEALTGERAEDALKLFEKLFKKLLKDKIPHSIVYRAYMNAAASAQLLFYNKQDEDIYVFAVQLLLAALRINPSYKLAQKIYNKEVEPYIKEVVRDIFSKKRAYKKDIELVKEELYGKNSEPYASSIFARYEKFLLEDMNLLLDFKA